MESAIPKHLQCPRLRHRRVPDDYIPPYPATVARYKPGVKQVVMAYFGVQYRGAPAPSAADNALQSIANAFGGDKGPGHWDRAVYVDEAGFTNIISVSYWDDPAEFDVWFGRNGAGWANAFVAGSAVGTFTEVLRPAIERFETLFSSDVLEGVACLADGFSGVVQEHAYWGGARDRIPMSQTDDMAPSGAPRVVTDGLHQHVIPYENICLIRSGQDWSATQADERRFGMSWWKSLAALERWAESHPTHLAIFGAAMKYLGTMGPAAKLKLYHEVTVAAAGEQYFEYYNCHPKTGMLRAAASTDSFKAPMRY